MSDYDALLHSCMRVLGCDEAFANECIQRRLISVNVQICSEADDLVLTEEAEEIIDPADEQEAVKHAGTIAKRRLETQELWQELETHRRSLNQRPGHGEDARTPPASGDAAPPEQHPRRLPTDDAAYSRELVQSLTPFMSKSTRTSSVGSFSGRAVEGITCRSKGFQGRTTNMAIGYQWPCSLKWFGATPRRSLAWSAPSTCR